MPTVRRIIIIQIRRRKQQNGGLEPPLPERTIENLVKNEGLILKRLVKRIRCE